MCRNVLGKEVKLFPWRKRLFKLYFPRLPSEEGKLFIELSAKFKVRSYVRFSPRQKGISKSLFPETLSSSRSLRLPIWGMSWVSWLLSNLSTCKLIIALMWGLMLFILLFRRSSRSRQGKFWQKSPSNSTMPLPYKSSIMRCSNCRHWNRRDSGIWQYPRSFKISSFFEVTCFTMFSTAD